MPRVIKLVDSKFELLMWPRAGNLLGDVLGFG